MRTNKNSMTLKDLEIGKSAVITAVGGEGALRQHFLDMGMIPGAEVTAVKLAPMGDPMELRIHGYELTIRIASREWFSSQKRDLVQNTVLYRDKDGASYIYIAGGENIVQYTFSRTDIADNEQFYDMVYSASYFSECIDSPDIDVHE